MQQQSNRFSSDDKGSDGTDCHHQMLGISLGTANIVPTGRTSKQ